MRQVLDGLRKSYTVVDWVYFYYRFPMQRLIPSLADCFTRLQVVSWTWAQAPLTCEARAQQRNWQE
jgi:hypothetical protein